MIRPLCLLTALAVGSVSGIAVAEEPSAFESELQRRGVAPTFEGIRKYLRLLQPTAAQKREAEALVGKLGDVKYRVREGATQQLIAMPHPPLELLKRAASGDDPEIRWRARSILKNQASRTTPLLHAILSVIEAKKLTGLTSEVLLAIPQLQRPYGTRIGTRALQATAVKADIPLLTKSLKDQDPGVRAAVVQTLPKVGGDAVMPTLRPHMRSSETSEFVRMAAAHAFAEAGKREAISPLINLLDGKDVTTRTQAAVTLNALTGKRFGFASYDTPDRRAIAVKKWKGWFASSGKTAALNHPLKLDFGARSYLNGNMLLCYGYRNKVTEFNADGKEIWSYAAQGAYGAEKLANGNILIACYAQKEILEVSPAKKVVWKMKVPSSLNARPLPNGNILVACHTHKEIWEVTRDKRVIWKYKHTGNCYDAHRLPNGNTIFSSDDGVFEVSPAGKVVWSNKSVGRCYGFQPLPNGNLLIAAYSRSEVIEVTRKGKTVWSHRISNPFDAYRLPNGNTLMSASSMFLEIDAKGKRLWTKTGNSYGRARK